MEKLRFVTRKLTTMVVPTAVNVTFLANDRKSSVQLNAWINNGSLSPSKDEVAFACNDGTFRILKIASIETPQTVNFGTRSDWVDHILWYKDSQERNFIACSIQNSVGIFCKQEGGFVLLRKLEGHQNTIQGIFFDKFKQRLTTVANKESSFWNHSDILSSSEQVLKVRNFSCNWIIL